MFSNFYFTFGIKSTAKACCGLYNAYLYKGGLSQSEAIQRVFLDRFKVSNTFRKNCNDLNANLFNTTNLNEVIFAIILLENRALAKKLGVKKNDDFNYNLFYERNIPLQKAVINVIEKQTDLKYELMDRFNFTARAGMIYRTSKY